MAKEKSDTSFSKQQLDVDAEGALSALEHAGAKAVDLIGAWVAQPNAAAVQAVAVRGSGAARKAARRGLNVLKSRKVPIPELRRVGTLGGRDKEQVTAWMMAPDPAGVRLICIGARSGSGRIRCCFVFLKDDEGIARIQMNALSASKLKESLKNVLKGAGYDAVEVPLAWARGKIAAARAAHKTSGRPEPLGFTQAADLLEPAPSEPAPHPFDEEGFELSDEDAKSMSADSADLHQLPEFRSWLPEQAAIQELLTKVGEHLNPGEEVPPEKFNEIINEEVLNATDRYFTPERRQELVGRMKDSALSALNREGEQAALNIAGTMKMVEKAGLITDPPRDIPFLRIYFEKAVAVLAAQNGGQLQVPVQRRPPETTDPETSEISAP